MVGRNEINRIERVTNQARYSHVRLINYKEHHEVAAPLLEHKGLAN
jgi:hypothetical protein